MVVPCGAGPVPHSHPNFEETFFVLEGEVTFRSENGLFLAQKGATVCIPKGGAIHNFKNNADQPAKLLCIVIPAGLDDYFVEEDEVINVNMGKEMNLKSSIKIISKKYDQELYDPNYWDM